VFVLLLTKVELVEFESLLSRMMEKSPLRRASLSDVMGHPWMMKEKSTLITILCSLGRRWIYP
jgi:serine/threonine protein kinase